MQDQGALDSSTARPKRNRKPPAYLANNYLELQQNITQEQDPICQDDSPRTLRAPTELIKKPGRKPVASSRSKQVLAESCDEEGDTSSEEGDTPRQLDQGRAKAAKAPIKSLKRALDLEERQELSNRRRKKKNEGTNKEYSIKIDILERWCQNGGYEVEVAPFTLDLSVPTEDAIGALCRFMDWYSRGRPGEQLRRGGRKAANGGLSQQTMTGVHAALQDYVKTQCELAGTTAYQLREQPGYDMVYDVYCNKDSSREVGNVTAPLYMAFTRDHYVCANDHYLRSSSPTAIRDQAVFTYQVAVVARGDDVRPRRLRELDVRVMDAVGPSQCQAITVMQPPAGGKTLGTRPAFKSFIRGMRPACCPVRALFASLVERFALERVPMPMPDDKDKWEGFLLFPTQEGKQMTPGNHHRLMLELFGALEVAPPKVTHELRIFAAQAMHEMGVSLEVIQRIGHWLLDSFGTAYIVPGFTPEALLALGFWPGAAQKDFTGFYAERFHVAIPEVLVQLLMPGLDLLEKAAAAEAEAAANNGKRANRGAPEASKVAKVLRMGAVVVVQDALELAEKFPENRVHQLLLEQQSFRDLLSAYKTFKSLGGFESQRPRSGMELMHQIELKVSRLQQHLQLVGQPGAVVSGASGLNWRAWERLQHEVQVDGPSMQQQQQQQQQNNQQCHGQLSVDVLAELEGIVTGRVQPSPRQQQRLQQQLKALLDDMGAELPFGGFAGDQDHGQQQCPAAAHAAAVGSGSSGAACAAAATAAGTSVVQEEPEVEERHQHQPGNSAPDVAAPVGSTPDEQQEQGGTPEGFNPPSPQQQRPALGQGALMVTPSGQQHTAEELARRTAHTLTPGGHYTTFFSLDAAAGLVQQQQQQQMPLFQQQMPLFQQQSGQPPCGTQQPGLSATAGAAAASGTVGRLQQQLQLLGQQDAQLQREIQQLEGQLRPIASQIASCAAGMSTGSQQVQLTDRWRQLTTDQQVLEQEQRQIRQQLQHIQQLLHQEQPSVPGYNPVLGTAGFSMQHLSQQQQQQQQLQQLGGNFLQQMGNIEPIGEILFPYTARSGAPLSSIQSGATSFGQGDAVPAAAVTNVLMEIKGQMASLQGQLAKLTGTALDAAVADGAAAAADGVAAVDGAAAAAYNEMPPAATGRVQPAAGTLGAAGSKHSKQASKPRGARAFPTLEQHGNMVGVAKFYFEKPLPDSQAVLDGADCKGNTPHQMQAADKHEWRGGKRGPDFRRWYELVAFMGKLLEKQVKMIKAQEKMLTVIDVAKAMDTERGQRSLNKYRISVVSGQEWEKEEAAAAAAASSGDEQQALGGEEDAGA